jgi:uncharacterized protein YabN with tetrapyrrole methylase and pyrophosphatase domain
LKQSLEELVELMLKNKEKCPWVKGLTLDSQKLELQSEVKEVLEAIDKKDYPNLKEELGDVLWDTLLLASLAEKEGLFTVKEVLNEVTAKIKRRKPWLLEGKEVSLEEAQACWFKAKEKEKGKQA